MIYAIALLLDPVDPAISQTIKAVMGKVEYIRCDRLIMTVVRGIDLDRLKASGEEILIRAVVEHDRLICELFSENTLLPLRFGTVFKSDLVLEAYLQSNYSELLTRLESLQGYSEYLLTLTLSNSKIETKLEEQETKPVQLKGRDYLLAKRTQYLLEQDRRSQQQQESQDLILLLPPQYQVVTSQADEFLRVYFLANSAQMQELEATIPKWQLEHSHWRLELSNPLPPYHFCD